MPRIRTSLLVTALAVLVPVAPPASHAAARVECHFVDFAPVAAHSKHVLCVDLVAEDPLIPTVSHTQHAVVRISNDNGKTWTTRTSSGLPELPEACEPPRPSPVALCAGGTGVVGAFHSAGWVADKTLYIGISGAGLYASTDDGVSWSLAAVTGSHAEGGVTYEPYHDTRQSPLSEAGSYPIAYVNNNYFYITFGEPVPAPVKGTHGFIDGPERIDPPTARPVSGVPEQLQGGFLFASAPRVGQPVLGLGATFGEGSGTWDFVTKMHTGLYVCDYDLSCSTRLQDFGSGQWAAVAMASDYAKSGVLFARAVDMRHIGDDKPKVTERFLRSTDAGKHFTAWTSLEALRKPARAVGGDANIYLVTREGNKAELSALLINWCDYSAKGNRCESAARPADYQFFHSRDNGLHWRLVSEFDNPGSRRAKRIIPWSTTKAPAAVASVQMGPQGRLVLQARSFQGTGLLGQTWYWDDVPDTSVLWCSLDHGRTWTSPCKG